MRLASILAPVTLAAALALTACTPAPVTPYVPATVSTTAPAPAAPVAKVATPAPVETPATDTIVAPPAPCEEDQPCWNCATMGNKICGPVAPPAVYVPAPRPVVKAQAPAPVARPAAPAVKPLQPATAPTPAAVAPKACDALTLGDGGTTAQHNCTPAPIATDAPFNSPTALAFVVVHYTNGVLTSCTASRGADVVPCTPATLKLSGTPSSAADVPCTLNALPCTATTRG